jgi:hypothetical protein
MRPEPSGLRLSLHHALPSTKVFVATVRGRVAGTVSVIEDSRIGLPIDELYRHELSVLRRQGRRISEVSALAIDEQHKTAGVPILTRLILLLVVHAKEIRKQDDICIAVNPRHVRFYRRLFPGAAEFGQLKSYGKVNGAPAVLLRLDLRVWPAAEEGCGDLGRMFEALSQHGELADLVVSLTHQSREAALTPQQFAQFFEDHPAFTTAPAEAREFVEAFYFEREPLEVDGPSLLRRIADLVSPIRFMPA